MQPGHYGKHGRPPQFVPTARRRLLRGLTPHGRLQSRLFRYRWTRHSVAFAVPRSPRRLPRVERDILTKKLNNRVTICSSNGAGCMGCRRDCQTPCSNSSKPDADSAPSECPEGFDEDRRAIWSVNNLAVPYEKKTSIVSTGNFELRSAAASGGLPHTSNLRRICIALPHASFVPPPDLLGTPECLVRVVERMTMTNAPFRLSTVHYGRSRARRSVGPRDSPGTARHFGR